MEKAKDNKEEKLIALFISLFFLYHFIKGRFFFESKIFEVFYLTFGVYYYFLIAYPLLISYSFSLEDNKKKMVLKTRLFFTVIFFFFCTLMIVMFQMRKYNLEGIRLEKQLIKISWVEDELGGLSTMLIDLLYFNFEKLHIYIFSTFIIFLSSFFIFGSTIRGIIKSIGNIKSFYVEKKELIKRERELEEKISIKESIEKEMLMKKEKYLQEKERKIREKVKKVLADSSQGMPLESEAKKSLYGKEVLENQPEEVKNIDTGL
ncbi:hypothetical protein [uncultured Ilyobacter sp.]|uniref:hypothetical protein n=1 Tax=uncultured Ilyobacter sp. TaxID=544433 RepID=UPI0029C77FB6|nr:hypothetical protein [uncultured Ilyobacter sp.]